MGWTKWGPNNKPANDSNTTPAKPNQPFSKSGTN